MARHPNVILLHTDQQRYDSLGCSGNALARTPSIDRLAAGGTVFTRHVVANPICSPSRASLLTGLYPPGHNLWCNGIALNRREFSRLNPETEGQFADNPLPGGFLPEPPTMADMFAAAGYDTVSFGKLHLTPYLAPRECGYPESWAVQGEARFANWAGPYYGFRRVELTLGHGEGVCRHGPYARWLRENHPDVLRQVEQARPARPFEGLDLYISSVPYAAHNSKWLADRLCSYIGTERPSDRPFFAFVGFPDPHHPFSPCRDIVPEFAGAPVQEPVDPDGAGTAGSPVQRLNQTPLDSVERAALSTVLRYTYAMVHQVDLAVGQILDALEGAGLARDTIVVFTSDHGDYLGDHGCLRKGFGASDSLLHVPLVLRAPGAGLPPRIDMPVSNCDVMPTLAALTGVSAPAHLDGADIVSVLRSGRDHSAFAYGGNGDPAAVNLTVYTATHRLSWYPRDDFVELFDHRTDPGETRNVATAPENRARVEDLRSRLAVRLARCYNPILGRVAAW